MALTPKHARFIAEYLKDPNATRAAVRAGYSERTAGSQASRLLKKVNIARIIDESMARRAQRVEVKQDDILRELLRLARTDIGQAFDAEGHLLPLHQMPEDVRRAISGLEVEELFDGTGRDKSQMGVVRKVKFWDKTKSLELLGKHLKLFTEKVEHSGALTLEQLVAGVGAAKPGDTDG